MVKYSNVDIEQITSSDSLSVSVDETGLIYLTFHTKDLSDHQHIELSAEVRGVYEIIKEKYPVQRFSILVDLTDAGNPSNKAAEMYIKTLSDSRIKKVAIYGMGGAIESIVRFIVAAAGKGEEVKFFIDKDEALHWLRQQ